jgi:DNA topoisomerase-1
MRFDGFLKVWPQKFQEKELPSLEEKTTLIPEEVLPLQHFTEPPARFTEASLIKTLEHFGIGRPSTYAPTISVIQIRNYVKKEAGKFNPTEIGELVNKVLTENFNEIVDIDFTAKMETSLDEVANGNERWQDLIGGFYLPFAKKLEEKYVDVKKEITDEPTDILCDKCSKPMIIKYGRFGKFIACTGFPECKNTKQLPKEAPKSTGLKCPDCTEGEIVERKVSRGRARGKIFWGCSKYPTCKYASWENPTGVPVVKTEKEPDTAVEEKEEVEEGKQTS